MENCVNKLEYLKANEFVISIHIQNNAIFRAVIADTIISVSECILALGICNDCGFIDKIVVFVGD